MFFIDVLAPNTGPVTLTINGANTGPVLNAAGAVLSAGEWQGRVLFTREVDGSYRIVNDPASALAAAQSATAARVSETAAAGSASDAANDRVATGQDRTATGLDRTATGQDRVATNADKLATSADRTATGQDKVATNADKVATAADTLAAPVGDQQTTILLYLWNSVGTMTATGFNKVNGAITPGKDHVLTITCIEAYKKLDIEEATS